MSTLSLSCFGPPRVEVDSQPVHISNQKALALLVYLAVTDTIQRRDSLATMLWPERDQSRARTYLRQALHALIQALGDAPFETSRETIGLETDANRQVDVRQFQAACAARERAEKDGLTRDHVTQLETAATLYCDEFLAGFSLPDCPEFDQWCHMQAESLRRQLGQILQTLIDWHAAQHEYDAAIAHAQRWLALDPLREAAHRTLMRLYAQSGRRAAAVRQYEQCVERLDAALGLAPTAQTNALHAAIQAGHLSPSPESRAETDETAASLVPPHNLPCPPTPLLGRGTELADLVRRLADPQVRLITIVGAGGMGKSRLALAAAEQALAHYPHGVYLVSLVGVDTPAALAPAVAGALGLDDAGSGSGVATLVMLGGLIEGLIRQVNSLAGSGSAGNVTVMQRDVADMSLSSLDERIARQIQAMPQEEGATPQQLAVASSQIGVAQSETEAAQSQIPGAEAGVRAAMARLESAKAARDKLLAGATAEEIAMAEARVQSARATLASAQAHLRQSQVIALFDGEVGAVHTHLGEMATAGQPLLLLGDTQQMCVRTTDLRETDVVHLTAGMPVEVTFDALPEAAFRGTVMEIAPVSTSEKGSTNYTVELDVADLDEDLRWGMTAFVNIQPD